MRTRDLARLFLVFTMGCASPTPGEPVLAAGLPPAEPGLTEMTLDQVIWSDDPMLPEFILRNSPMNRTILVAHVKTWHGFPAMKQFTQDADPNFELFREGMPPVPVQSGVGGITSSDGRYRFTLLYPAKGKTIDRSLTYQLRPMNQDSACTWRVDPDVADLLCEAVQFGPLWAGFDRCSGEFEKVTSGSVRLPEAFMAFKVETRRWGLSRAD